MMEHHPLHLEDLETSERQEWMCSGHSHEEAHLSSLVSDSLPQGPKHRKHGRGQSAPSTLDLHPSRPIRTDCGHYKHS